MRALDREIWARVKARQRPNRSDPGLFLTPRQEELLALRERDRMEATLRREDQEHANRRCIAGHDFHAEWLEVKLSRSSCR